MPGVVKPIAEGYHAVTPYLIVKGGARAIEFYQRAAGAKLTRPVETQFDGDRSGGLTDPFGHLWYVAAHVEDVPADELERRARAGRRTQS